MVAAFSFGFAGDDMDDDGPPEIDRGLNSEHYPVTHTISLPVKRHSLESLLSHLPSCLSYNYLHIPILSNENSNDNQNTHGSLGGAFTVPRRSLFDIRTQLMAESTLDENRTDDLISGLTAGDLSSGVYEGGFKTWECAVDLAGFVADHVTFTKDQHWEVIELGAGSAIPSLALLRRALSRTRVGNETLKFSLCDYNEEVLQLVTVPNILLSWWDVCTNSDRTRIKNDRSGEADLDDINEDVIQSFFNDCKSRGISFSFISGAWGSPFVHLIESSLESETDVPTGQCNLVIMASETIYCPSSLAAFVSTIMDLLRARRGRATAFVAGKRIYFGVGGGVIEFAHEIQRVGGSVKEVIDITDNGVGRVILEVSLAPAIK